MISGKQLFFAVVICFTPAPVLADVQPEQVAIVANDLQVESMQLAAEYAKARRIPDGHILQIRVPFEETISREAYEEQVVRPLRKQIQEKHLAEQLKVLVTMFGIPLRVAAPELKDEDKKIVLDAASKQKSALSAIVQIAAAAEAVAPQGSKTEEKKAPVTGQTDEQLNQEAVLRAKEALMEAAKRSKALQDKAQEQQEAKKLTALVVRFGGLNALLSSARRAGSEQNERAAATVAALEKELASAGKILQALDQTTNAGDRQRAYAITEKMYGLLGVLGRATKEVEARRYEQGDASLDSELSLLWWDRDMYKIAGRLPNPLFYPVLGQNPGKGLLLPVLMVSRLDAPSAADVRTMISGAVLAERHGLRGKVYVDTRGLKFKYRDEFSRWDQDMRDFAWLLRKRTDYTVSLDEKEKLLDEAKDTAVYMGWYSLRSYKDVFTFSPGALGWHVASEEAVSIHNPGETGWCKNMLERGATATLGAVAEPYLDSFPMPQKFFGLLLNGRYSLVEAYYLTTPYLSWRMILFGDPLYNPWRGKNLVKADDFEERTKGLEMKALPVFPGSLTVGDPASVIKQIKSEREQLHGKLEQFFQQLQQQMKKVTPETIK